MDRVGRGLCGLCCRLCRRLCGLGRGERRGGDGGFSGVVLGELSLVDERGGGRVRFGGVDIGGYIRGGDV